MGTGTFPSSSVHWNALSKDLDSPDPSIIEVYAIGLDKQKIRTLTANDAFVSYNSDETLTANHPSNSSAPLNGFALCGGGATAHWYNKGNYLWKLEPTIVRSEDPADQSFSAASKDHIHPESCTLTTYAMGIKLAT